MLDGDGNSDYGKMLKTKQKMRFNLCYIEIEKCAMVASHSTTQPQRAEGERDLNNNKYMHLVVVVVQLNHFRSSFISFLIFIHLFSVPFSVLSLHRQRPQQRNV